MLAVNPAISQTSSLVVGVRKNQLHILVQDRRTGARRESRVLPGTAMVKRKVFPKTKQGLGAGIVIPQERGKQIDRGNETPIGPETHHPREINHAFGGICIAVEVHEGS